MKKTQKNSDTYTCFLTTKVTEKLLYLNIKLLINFVIRLISNLLFQFHNHLLENSSLGGYV